MFLLRPLHCIYMTKNTIARIQSNGMTGEVHKISCSFNNILLKSDAIPGNVYNVHCSPSTNVDVGVSASVKADAVFESPKKHNNVLLLN